MSGQIVGDAALREALARASGEVPPDRRGALRATATATGVEISAAWRLAGGWEVRGYATRLWGRPGWQGAAEARWSW